MTVFIIVNIVLREREFIDNGSDETSLSKVKTDLSIRASAHVKCFSVDEIQAFITVGINTEIKKKYCQSVPLLLSRK